MSKIIILSDIHANISALSSVLEDCRLKYDYEYMALLGDIVNYGMSPNEVINELKSVGCPVLVNLWGNHEKALFDGDTRHFSTGRGREALAFTRNMLTEDSKHYLSSSLSRSGTAEIVVGGKRILFVHGTLSDPFWGKMTPVEMMNPTYAKYDYVVSGHSHIPGLSEIFYKDETAHEYRNKKRTVFMNPGSVGQPRNHNPRAQYLFMDIGCEIFHFNSVAYDLDHERSLYVDGVDGFYKDRLTKGI